MFNHFFNTLELVSLAIEKLGLSDLYPFKPEEKIIEYMIEISGNLASMKVKEFLSELASSSPAPGGGSVAALAGSLGAALTSMVCNLTIGKEKYASVEDEIKDVLRESERLRFELTKLIDKDTEAFNDVIKAFKMPKETEKQKEERNKAIQNGYKKAAIVPFETAKLCEEILDLAKTVAEKGNQSSITDAAVSVIEVLLVSYEIDEHYKRERFEKTLAIKLDDFIFKSKRKDLKSIIKGFLDKNPEYEKYRKEVYQTACQIMELHKNKE